MKLWCEHPHFFLGLGLMGLAGLAEAGGIVASHAAARTARRRLDRVGREWREVSSLVPAVTVERAGRIEADLRRGREQLAGWRGELMGRGWPAGGREPAQRSEAYFDLAALVERLREHAGRRGVKLKPEERFGFSAYAHEAPELERLAAVHREQVIVEHLLTALFEARPSEFLGVQREQPRRRPGQPAAGRAGARSTGTEAGDYFEPDARVLVRKAGVVETTAYQVSFTGPTTALRTLLNTLADSDLPVLVRAVDVAPAEANRGGAEAKRAEGAPLVGRSGSRFTVVIEAIEPGGLMQPEAGIPAKLVATRS
jgi:hypothetical protein